MSPSAIHKPMDPSIAKQFAHLPIILKNVTNCPGTNRGFYILPFLYNYLNDKDALV